MILVVWLLGVIPATLIAQYAMCRSPFHATGVRCSKATPARFLGCVWPVALLVVLVWLTLRSAARIVELSVKSRQHRANVRQYQAQVKANAEFTRVERCRTQCAAMMGVARAQYEKGEGVWADVEFWQTHYNFWVTQTKGEKDGQRGSERSG